LDAVKEALSSLSHVLKRSYVEKVYVTPELIHREGNGIPKLHVMVQMVRLRKPSKAFEKSNAALNAQVKGVESQKKFTPDRIQN
jgi:hypothetical protein